MLGVGLRGRKEGVTLGSVMYEVNVVYLHGIWLHSEIFVSLSTCRRTRVKLLLVLFSLDKITMMAIKK